jgi:hypothetical protein
MVYLMVGSIRDDPHRARKTRIDYEWYFDDLKFEDVTDTLWRQPYRHRRRELSVGGKTNLS